MSLVRTRQPAHPDPHFAYVPPRSFPSDFGTMPLGVKCVQIPAQGSFARSDDLLVRQSPNLEFWRANQHFCSLFSSGKLDFEPVARLPACPSAAPLIAHCDKDRVDIGQRRGDAPPVRGDFLVIR